MQYRTIARTMVWIASNLRTFGGIYALHQQAAGCWWGFSGLIVMGLFYEVTAVIAEMLNYIAQPAVERAFLASKLAPSGSASTQAWAGLAHLGHRLTPAQRVAWIS